MDIGKKVNLNVQGNENTHVDVNILLGKSHQYNELLDQLKTNEKLFERTPEDETAERLEISAKINELKDFIEQFKRDVLALAETFNKIEINTERLKRAKEFFDKGEVGEARAVLETELEQMQDEQTHLLREKEHFEQDVLPNLINNSDEFLLLAMSTQADFNIQNRFEDAYKYFENSIKSYVTKTNIFEFAVFLGKQNKLSESKNYFNLFLDKFANKINLAEKASALNNLGILHRYHNENEKSLKFFEEALEIYRGLINKNEGDFLLELAAIQSNLGVSYTQQNELEKALANFNESLKIREKLAEINPDFFLPLVASSLINLANFYLLKNDQEKSYETYNEALEIYSRLSDQEPGKFLQDISLILNNLASIYWKQQLYEKASETLKKALKIRIKLAKENPDAFLPDVAMTLSNLSILYSEQGKHRKSEKGCKEAIKIYQNLAGNNPNAFLIYVAQTFNNLGNIYKYQNKFAEALKEYEEALKIKKNLFNENPSANASSLAMTMINIADIHQRLSADCKKSIDYALNSLIILLPFVENIPETATYYVTALNILNNWKSDEEISLMIEEKMNENELCTKTLRTE